MKAVMVVCLGLAALAALWALGCGQTGEQAEPAMKEIALPAPVTTGGMSLTEAISKRRSVREFAPDPLTMEQISQLCWAGQGITDPEHGRRAAPSAGATYPIELYLLTKEGVFHYVPQGHKLALLDDDDHRDDLSNAALEQESVAQAPLDIVIAGVFSRTEAKYGERARQYVFQESGHVAENIVLQGVALGLGSVTVGAFREQAVAGVLGLPDEQTALYVVPVGRGRAEE
ncbi:MAG: SagB/ThcOx family dehydrogenase [Armatimonadota bacterium]